jgi:hypothetical protein
MKIHFILASDFPSQIHLGFFMWRYIDWDNADDGYIYRGKTFAIGLIFFHFGISISRKENFFESED